MKLKPGYLLSCALYLLILQQFVTFSIFTETLQKTNDNLNYQANTYSWFDRYLSAFSIFKLSTWDVFPSVAPDYKIMTLPTTAATVLPGLDMPSSTPPAAPSLLKSTLWNALLITLFALHHSLISRPKFQEITKKVIGEAGERTHFMVSAALVMFCVMVNWEFDASQEFVLWDFTGFALLYILTKSIFIFATFWIFLSVATSAWYDLFRLHNAFTGVNYDKYAVPNNIPLIYKFTRAPLFTGCIVSYFAATQMTTSRLLFSVLMAIYLRIGLSFQESDVLKKFGKKYKDYQMKVPLLIPNIKSYWNFKPSHQEDKYEFLEVSYSVA